MLSLIVPDCVVNSLMSWLGNRCSEISDIRLRLKGAGQRKVRAPKGRVPGNAWGAEAYGKCRREQTADDSFANTGKGERVW